MTQFNSHADLDQRIRKTRMALFEAFAGLVLERDYHEISVSDIIAKAGISRSTFYQHYRNKDDILAGSMSYMFAVLADAACGQGNVQNLVGVLDHWWENRTLGRIILNGPAYRRLARELTESIDAKMDPETPNGTAPVKRRLRALQLAEGQLGLIRAWLSGEVNCSTTDLVDNLTQLESRSGSSLL